MRTVEQVLRDYLGDQVITLAKLTAEIERLRAENLRLTKQAEVSAIYRPAAANREAYEMGKGS